MASAKLAKENLDKAVTAMISSAVTIALNSKKDLEKLDLEELSENKDSLIKVRELLKQKFETVCNQLSETNVAINERLKKRILRSAGK